MDLRKSGEAHESNSKFGQFQSQSIGASPPGNIARSAGEYKTNAFGIKSAKK